jgi:hypothetical protein
MSKSPSMSRRQRRNYENWLKKNQPIEYAKWKAGSLERGKTLQENHTNAILEKQDAYYQDRQANMIIELQSKGLSQEEIDRQVSIWTLTIKPWGTTEKALTLKEATKQYELEFNNDKDSAK